MRRLFSFLAAGALALGLSAQSHAGPITSGIFSINLLGQTFGSVANGTISGSASSASNATLGAGNAFAALATTSFVTNSTQAVSAISVYINNNTAGSFSGSPVAGNAVFTGMATIFLNGPWVVIPLAVGQPGVQFVTKLDKKGACSLCLTAINASWTAGSAVITNVFTTLAGPFKNITVMGNNALTPGGGGTLTLVSPGKVIANLTGPIPLIGTLTLTYAQVPEPGTLLLLGAGVVVLAAIGRRRAA